MLSNPPSHQEEGASPGAPGILVSYPISCPVGYFKLPMPSTGSGVSPAREGVRESRGSGGTSPFPLILWPERSGREQRAPLRGAQKDDRASKKKLPLPPAYNPSVTFGDSSATSIVAELPAGRTARFGWNGGALRIFDSNRAISPLAKPLDCFAGKRPLPCGSLCPFGASAHRAHASLRQPLTQGSLKASLVQREVSASG